MYLICVLAYGQTIYEQDAHGTGKMREAKTHCGRSYQGATCDVLLHVHVHVHVHGDIIHLVVSYK